MAFYVLGQQDLWLRVVALLVLVALAVAAFFTSEPGKQLIAFGQDSVSEVKKVVWPTRKEALQMTGYVFALRRSSWRCSCGSPTRRSSGCCTT